MCNYDDVDSVTPSDLWLPLAQHCTSTLRLLLVDQAQKSAVLLRLVAHTHPELWAQILDVTKRLHVWTLTTAAEPAYAFPFFALPSPKLCLVWGEIDIAPIFLWVLLTCALTRLTVLSAQGIHERCCAWRRASSGVHVSADCRVRNAHFTLRVRAAQKR